MAEMQRVPQFEYPERYPQQAMSPLYIQTIAMNVKITTMATSQRWRSLV